MLQTLYDYLQYPFVQYALVVGVLIALCASLLGVTLVLKRFSYIGDGLSHVAFGTMAVGTMIGLGDNMLFVLPATVLCAIFLLRSNMHAKVRGDAAIAMLSVGSMGVGYLLFSIFSPTSNLAADVCSTLFGSTSILTLTQVDVIVSIVLAIVVIGLFLLFYHKIFAVTFDASFMNATGVKADFYNLLIAIIIAVIIVLAMNLVGTLLISALVIFPALSAMRIFGSFRAVTIFSAIFSVTCALLGLLASILIGSPVGSTIVCVDILGFLLCYLIGKVKGALA